MRGMRKISAKENGSADVWVDEDVGEMLKAVDLAGRQREVCLYQFAV